MYIEIDDGEREFALVLATAPARARSQERQHRQAQTDEDGHAPVISRANDRRAHWKDV
jgi:hypothetical protein